MRVQAMQPWFKWLCHSFCIVTVLGSQTCTRFGNNLAQSMPPNNNNFNLRSGTFVNISSPLNCPGNATQWNMCYYSATSEMTSTTYFGVYRLSSGTMYNLVNMSSTMFTMSRNNSAFACSQFPIPQAQQYAVVPGDILVVCVQSRGAGRLGIVASVTGTSDSVLRDSNPCTALPSSPIDTSSGGGVYSQSIGYTLHVSLDVNECAVNNGGCAQICTDLPLGNNCSCYSGYGMVQNGSCIDINECSTNNGNCSQICTNTIGSFICSCNSGYQLVADNKTCTLNTMSAVSPGAIVGIIIVVIFTVIAIITVVGLVVLYVMKHYQKWKPSVTEVAMSNALYSVPDQVTTTGHVKSHVQDQDTNFNMYETPGLLTKETQFCDPVYETTVDEAHDEPSPYCIPATQESDLYEQMQAQKIRNISMNKIERSKELGHGQFGSVFKGYWDGPLGHLEVAIKALNPNKAQPDSKVKLLQEAAIMAQFRHSNVIQLYGIVTEGPELMLVIELADKGDLRNHLTSLKPDPGELVLTSLAMLLLSYSKQIALGMQYLAEKSFVHRDLAARNILLAAKGTKNICKIADFGLSRDLADENYYVSNGGMVPLKWTAPEAVHYKKYSTASDVWSYGCLLYEIWSVGHKPFEGMGNAEVVEKVDAGYRLPPPPGCPLLIYHTMIQCWNPDVHSRPQFRAIHLSLSQNEEQVINIPNEAIQTHPQAGVLSAPLEAGQNMYLDLQRIYIATSN